MGYGSGLPVAVAGFSREPSAGKIVAAPPSALNCKKLLRPRTENDLEGNRYIANLLTSEHPNSLNSTLRPKRSPQWQNFPLASIVTACPLRLSLIAWTHFSWLGIQTLFGLSG